MQLQKFVILVRFPIGDHDTPSILDATVQSILFRIAFAAFSPILHISYLSISVRSILCFPDVLMSTGVRLVDDLPIDFLLTFFYWKRYDLLDKTMCVSLPVPPLIYLVPSSHVLVILCDQLRLGNVDTFLFSPTSYAKFQNIFV